MRRQVLVAWQGPAQTHSRFGHSSMYVCEEKAAPLSLQKCWHWRISETMLVASVISIGDEDFVHVRVDRARALHEVEDRLQHGRLYLPGSVSALRFASS